MWVIRHQYNNWRSSSKRDSPLLIDNVLLIKTINWTTWHFNFFFFFFLRIGQLHSTWPDINYTYYIIWFYSPFVYFLGAVVLPVESYRSLIIIQWQKKTEENKLKISSGRNWVRKQRSKMKAQNQLALYLCLSKEKEDNQSSQLVDGDTTLVDFNGGNCSFQIFLTAEIVWTSISCAFIFWFPIRFFINSCILQCHTGIDVHGFSDFN